LLADDANDAVLVLNVATGLASATDAARAVVETVRRDRQAGTARSPCSPSGSGRTAPRRTLGGGRHPELRHGGRGGEGLHAPRPLPGGAGRPDEDARRPPPRFRARGRGRAPDRRRLPPGGPDLARPDRGERALRAYDIPVTPSPSPRRRRRRPLRRARSWPRAARSR
jgi:hypothetical protein